MFDYANYLLKWIWMQKPAGGLCEFVMKMTGPAWGSGYEVWLRVIGYPLRPYKKYRMSSKEKPWTSKPNFLHSHNASPSRPPIPLGAPLPSSTRPFLHCQVDGISLLSSPTTHSHEPVWGLREELGHLWSSTVIAVANSAVNYVEHLERELSKVWPKQHSLYALASGTI